MMQSRRHAGATMPDLRAEIESLAKACGGVVSLSVRNISNAFDLALNDDVRLQSASTIKVSILVEALRQARDGVLALDREYGVPREVCCPGSGVLMKLHQGIVVTLQDLLTLMIITSDNTATNMCIDIVGIENVNTTLRRLGYPGTTLGRKMYDWEGLAQGRDNWVVAREMTDLLVKLAHGDVLGEEYDRLALDIMGGQQHVDQLGLFLPEGVLASKTGQVGTVVHDFGVVTTPDFRYAIAVFTGDAPVMGEAKIAIGRISKLVYDAAGAGKTC